MKLRGIHPRQILAKMKKLSRHELVRRHNRKRLARMKGLSNQEIRIAFCRYRYALQALEAAAIPAETIEAARRELIAFMPSGGIWVLPDEYVIITTTKSGKCIRTTKSGKRLGCNIEPGYILYEVWGVAETIALIALTQAASKTTLPGNTIPIKTQILYKKKLDYL